MPTTNVVPMADGIIDPKTVQDYLNWEMSQEAIQASRKKLQEELLQMASAMQHSNPMFYAQMIMFTLTDEKGQEIGGLSNILNLDTDMRTQVTVAQDAMNSQTPGNTTFKDMKAFENAIDSLEAFLKQQQGLGSNSPLDQGLIKSMLSAIDQIKTQFGSDWGNIGLMAADWMNWLQQANNGTAAPQINSIQNGLQTLTQSVSALSTTTNTQLQFMVQIFQQILSIVNSAMRTQQEGTSTFVKNQKSN